MILQKLGINQNHKLRIKLSHRPILLLHKYMQNDVVYVVYVEDAIIAV
jgi:hypothetical protein